ncbi:hypothetical protein LL266_18630 [Vibrio anguillarum]|uniref:hypothetical protein n=1 Tax=Vibrio anguillarum TaxID=55601 RepID=UPI0018FEEF72|nr:hypothetical protein [Vibrio anguillarum]MCC4238480.1 hypothetical protein [Vibrio anguillarum]
MNQNDYIGKTLKPWPILVDHYNIQRLRNKIMHAANECSSEDAQQAIDITVEFVSIIVAVIRNFSLDLSSEGLVIDYVDPNQQSLF